MYSKVKSSYSARRTAYRFIYQVGFFLFFVIFCIDLSLAGVNDLKNVPSCKTYDNYSVYDVYSEPVLLLESNDTDRITWLNGFFSPVPKQEAWYEDYAYWDSLDGRIGAICWDVNRDGLTDQCYVQNTSTFGERIFELVSTNNNDSSCHWGGYWNLSGNNTNCEDDIGYNDTSWKCTYDSFDGWLWGDSWKTDVRQDNYSCIAQNTGAYITITSADVPDIMQGGTVSLKIEYAKALLWDVNVYVRTGLADGSTNSYGAWQDLGAVPWTGLFDHVDNYTFNYDYDDFALTYGAGGTASARVQFKINVTSAVGAYPTYSFRLYNYEIQYGVINTNASLCDRFSNFSSLPVSSKFLCNLRDENCKPDFTAPGIINQSTGTLSTNHLSYDLGGSNMHVFVSCTDNLGHNEPGYYVVPFQSHINRCTEQYPEDVNLQVVSPKRYVCGADFEDDCTNCYNYTNYSFQLYTGNGTIADLGSGVDGDLIFTTGTKSYGNLVLNKDYTIAGNTLYFMLNKPYQFTNFYLGSGTTLSTLNTSGAVLFIQSRGDFHVNGTVSLNSKLSNGQRTDTFSFKGLTINSPSVGNGGSGGGGYGGSTGGAQGDGYGGGGGGGQVESCGVIAPGGGNGRPGGKLDDENYGSGGDGSSSYVEQGAGQKYDYSNGATGIPYSSGGGGGSCAYLPNGGWGVWESSNAGDGGDAYGSLGTSASTFGGHDAFWGVMAGHSASAGGGGGAGGESGSPGIHFYAYGNTVILNGSLMTGATAGTDGGNGGKTYYGYFVSGSWQEWEWSNGGGGGGGGGGGNGGDIKIYYNSSLVNQGSTFIRGGGSGGTGGLTGSGSASGGAGTTGSQGTLTLAQLYTGTEDLYWFDQTANIGTCNATGEEYTVCAEWASKDEQSVQHELPSNPCKLIDHQDCDSDDDCASYDCNTNQLYYSLCDGIYFFDSYMNSPLTDAKCTYYNIDDFTTHIDFSECFGNKYCNFSMDYIQRADLPLSSNTCVDKFANNESCIYSFQCLSGYCVNESLSCNLTKNSMDACYGTCGLPDNCNCSSDEDCRNNNCDTNNSPFIEQLPCDVYDYYGCSDYTIRAKNYTRSFQSWLQDWQSMCGNKTNTSCWRRAYGTYSCGFGEYCNQYLNLSQESYWTDYTPPRYPCVACKDNGDSCEDRVQCCSGYCSGGTCQNLITDSIAITSSPYDDALLLNNMFNCSTLGCLWAPESKYKMNITMDSVKNYNVSLGNCVRDLAGCDVSKYDLFYNPWFACWDIDGDGSYDVLVGENLTLYNPAETFNEFGFLDWQLAGCISETNVTGFFCPGASYINSNPFLYTANISHSYQSSENLTIKLRIGICGENSLLGNPFYYYTDTNDTISFSANLWFLCHDGLQDGDETAIDYGGKCGNCSDLQLSPLIDEILIDYGGKCGTCFDNLLSPDPLNSVYGSFGETEADYGGDICGVCNDKGSSDDMMWSLAREINKGKVPFEDKWCSESGGAVTIIVVAVAFILFLLLIALVLSLFGMSGVVSFIVSSGIKAGVVLIQLIGKTLERKRRKEDDEQKK